jgi:carbonic anhydrase
MSEIEKLFQNNRDWQKQQLGEDPEFFNNLLAQQNPKYLWIGCSDSRVPANQITGLAPGEVFVHRNVANLVIHTDINCLSVIQYAVEVLKVEDIIVCGHYGCGGVRAACGTQQFGLIDNWLRHIKDIFIRHKEELDGIAAEEKRADRLCELNVLEQVHNVCHTSILQNAWQRGQKIAVHGVIYGVGDGLLHDLAIRITSAEQIDSLYRLQSRRKP